MNTELLKVAIRYNAIFIPQKGITDSLKTTITETTGVLVANCNQLGFSFSEDLLFQMNGISPNYKLNILELLKDITGVEKNWTPLVKQWNIPTNESRMDHNVTFFANTYKAKIGTRLLCGHLIPNNTFPLDRYNGCPYCGTPFEIEKLDYKMEQNKLQTLDLWTNDDLEKLLISLTSSPVALNATQIDSLTILLNHFDLPSNIEVKIKETLMVLIDILLSQDKAELANKLFKNPNDILRYLWFKHTGYLQIIQPKTIVNRMGSNALNIQTTMSQKDVTENKVISGLKLKFSRKECKQYALWINSLKMGIEKQCEIMHPKRGIWIRIIRALRLAEYSKKKGFENLAMLMDVFYNETYEVWEGRMNHFKLKYDAENTFKLLKQRPGLFARSLFSCMLWFGKDITIQNFKEIMNQVPSRLIFTLNMYADIYFVKNGSRNVKPLGGTNKKIPTNKLLNLYSNEQLQEMKAMIQDLSLELIKMKFAKEQNENKSIYIDPALYNIPIAIGDRTENIMDKPDALMGMRFPIEGNTVRLFLQWGQGLPAQHLDMDLSCRVTYQNKMDFCSYSQLVVPGCKHSGDIQSIPEKVGTAEYIDIDINSLNKRNAKYVIFTCNSYSNGSLAPNLVVGWMNSKYPMKISRKGVAYNPSNVQHQVKIKQSMTKGMVFGVLDVAKREIIWLEMGFGGQVVQNLNTETIEALLDKLNAKLKIGELLQLKAEVQQLKIETNPELADEKYDSLWALNTAEVSQLFLA